MTDLEPQKKFTFTKKNKIILSIAAGFLVLDLVLVSLLIIFRNSARLRLNVVEKENDGTVLVCLDSPARKNFVHDKQTADYKFTSKQKSCFEEIYGEKGSAALTLRLSFKAAAYDDAAVQDSVFCFGFLDKNDFTRNGRFIKNNFGQNKRVVIQGSVSQLLQNYDDGTVDVSIALPKKNDYEQKSYKADIVPEGFFIYSTEGCRILDACITPAVIGFDASENIPFYGFSYNGGKIDFSNSGFDFSGSSIVFAAENSKEKLMPEYKVVFSDDESLKSTFEKKNNIEISLGGEKLYVNNIKNAEAVIIPSGALKYPFSRMELTKQKNGVKAFVLENPEKADSLCPVKTDPGLILKYPESKWRNIDYEFFQWDRFPDIIFFDTRNYEVQNRMLSRMAYFVEKAGYKGTLVSNAELEGKHGYNAHDYSSASMEEFFNKAVRENFSLNEEELALKKILIASGLFESDGNFVKAVKGGIVSISRESSAGLRSTLMVHEGYHTLFFGDEEFRNYVAAVYYTMDPSSRSFLIDYFKSQPGLGYDTNDEYLMHNEFMAYLLQQRLSEVGNYFVHHANRGSVMAYTPDLSAYVRNTKGQGFEDAAAALNDYVFDKYGTSCGNISLVYRN